MERIFICILFVLYCFTYAKNYKLKQEKTDLQNELIIEKEKVKQLEEFNNKTINQLEDISKINRP